MIKRPNFKGLRTKLIGMVCALVLCLGLAPAAAFADSGTFTAEDGNVYHWWNFTSGSAIIVSSIDVNNSDVVMPDTIENCPVSCLGNVMIEYCTYADGQSIKSLTLPATMGSSGWQRQMHDCTSLEKLTLLGGYKIDKKTFKNCTNLHDVYLLGDQTNLDFQTHNADPDSTFYGCKAIRFHTYADNANLTALVEGSNATAVAEGEDAYTYSIVRHSKLENATIEKVDDQLVKAEGAKPSLVVKDEFGNKLTEGTDYTVTYSDNTAVGTATATITGTNRQVEGYPSETTYVYEGTNSVQFQVKDLIFHTWDAWGLTVISSIESAVSDVVIPDDLMTEGNTGIALGNKMASLSTFTVPLKSLTLPSNMVGSSWSQQLAGLTDLESVTFMNGYKLEKKLFKNCTNLHDVYLMGDQTNLDFNSYDASSNSAFCGCKAIRFHTYADNANLTALVEGSNATAVAEGEDAYTYSIVRHSKLENATIEKVDDQLVKAEGAKPSLVVKDEFGNKLTEGTDYTVTYSDNTAVGTATATITGTNRQVEGYPSETTYVYEGTNSVQFQVKDLIFHTWDAWGLTVISSIESAVSDVVIPDDLMTEGNTGIALGNKMASLSTFTVPLKSLTLPSNMVGSSWSQQLAGLTDLESVTFMNGYKLEKKLLKGCTNLHDVYLEGDQSGLDFNAYDTSSSSPFTETTKICFHVDENNENLTKFVEACNLDESYEYTIDVLPGDKAFVKRLYRNVMGRVASGEEVDFQADAMKTYGAAQITYNFYDSEEFANKSTTMTNEEIVENVYQTLLGRASDEAGLAMWKGYLDNGMSACALVAGFAESDEFKALCAGYGVDAGSADWLRANKLESRDKNPGVTSFVYRLYTVVLDRAADVAGLNVQCQALIDGAACWDMATRFFDSQEYINFDKSDTAFVADCYKAMMDREGSSDEIDAWVARMAKEGLSRVDVVKGFCQSDEFEKICQDCGMTSGMR